MWGQIKFFLAVLGGGSILRALFLFSKTEIINGKIYQRLCESDRSVILILWHGQMLPSIYALRYQGIHAMVGYHQDAEMIARVINRWGYSMIRGSSRDRGKQALEQALKLAYSSENVLAITTDGPIGPYRKCKPGAAIIAERTGAVILPMATNCSRKKILTQSWDKFCLPLPFSHNIVKFGTPVFPQGIYSQDAVAHTTALMEEQLTQLQSEVDSYFE